MVSAADIDLQFAGDQVGDLVDDTHIVQSNDLQTGKERDFFVLGPFCFYHAVAVVGQQLRGIGTVGAVDGESLAGGYKTKYVIAGNGLAAIGQGVHDLSLLSPKMISSASFLR